MRFVFKIERPGKREKIRNKGGGEMRGGGGGGGGGVGESCEVCDIIAKSVRH